MNVAVVAGVAGVAGVAEVTGAAGVAGVARVAGAARVTKAAGHRLCPLTSVLAKSVFFSLITGKRIHFSFRSSLPRQLKVASSPCFLGKEYTFSSAHLYQGN